MKEQVPKKQQAEKELVCLEKALIDPSCPPESSDNFEHLVLSSPNSSILWVQYLTFNLQATETEKDQAMAKRHSRPPPSGL